MSSEQQQRQQPEDDWDRIERLTRRVRRWGIVGIPTWFVALAILHPRYTNIPLGIGFVMGSLVALVVVVADDRRRHAGRRSTMTPFGRVLLVWVISFMVLAIVLGAGGATGAALVLVPFLGAALVTAMVEFARTALARGARDRR